MNLNRIAINGRFVVRNLTGQERFAREILDELDELTPHGALTLVIPKYAKTDKIPKYKNIKIVKWGYVKSHFWEQIDFLSYLILKRKTGLNLCTTCPILKPDINTIHDIVQYTQPQLFNSSYARISSIWYTLIKNSTIAYAKGILTVSQFSKDEMIRFFKIEDRRVFVLGNGWEHINRIKEDSTFFKRNKQIKAGEYFFAASSLTPQKNFKWIIEAAKNNPDALFVIAGKRVGLTDFNITTNTNSNIIYLGYVSDAEMKVLMKNCKAFIHPATYEGFGIPPLEALANGAKVIVSQASCLPEIFKKSVYYIDPNDPSLNINKLLNNDVEDRKPILEKYSWKKFAQQLLNYLNEM